jgi:aarF domain-containing kinase
VVEEFSVVLRNQADLTIEAQNLRQFRTNFYRNSETREHESSIIFPQPIDGWTAPQVIVEDYVGDAVPIATFLHDSSPEGMEIRKKLAGPLLRAFLKMVFTDNYIHCDLHPVSFAVFCL